MSTDDSAPCKRTIRAGREAWHKRAGMEIDAALVAEYGKPNKKVRRRLEYSLLEIFTGLTAQEMPPPPSDKPKF